MQQKVWVPLPPDPSDPNHGPGATQRYRIEWRTFYQDAVSVNNGSRAPLTNVAIPGDPITIRGILIEMTVTNQGVEVQKGPRLVSDEFLLWLDRDASGKVVSYDYSTTPAPTPNNSQIESEIEVGMDPLSPDEPEVEYVVLPRSV